MWTDPARLAAPSAGERIAAVLRHTPDLRRPGTLHRAVLCKSAAL